MIYAPHTTDPTTLTDPAAAVAAAEADALAQHRAGKCGESEWSCSHCERESAR